VSGALSQNAITVIITAGPASQNFTPPTFGPGRSNTLTLSGYRVAFSMSIAPPGSVAAEISVSNLDFATANSLSTYGAQFAASNGNTVTVLAGNAVTGMSQIYSGNIQAAFADFSGMPDVSFNISSITSLDASLLPVPPSSYAGPVNVATIMQNLAQIIGYKFENNGVTKIITNPYLPGTAWDQIKSLARAADINFVLHNGVLAIWNIGGYRGSTVPVVSPSSGLIGYPSFDVNGVNFRTLFRPDLTFGGQVTVQSSLQPACGTRNIYSMDYDLESQTPDGNWFIDVGSSLWTILA
jgi:hypothetical protein